jgi:hypothetical protein
MRHFGRIIDACSIGQSRYNSPGDPDTTSYKRRMNTGETRKNNLN